MRSCYNGLYFWNIHSRRRSWLVFHKILQLLYDIVRITRLVYIASNTSLFLFQASISFVSFDIVLFHTFFFLPHTSLPFPTVTLCRTPQEYQCFLVQNEWREPSSSDTIFLLRTGDDPRCILQHFHRLRNFHRLVDSFHQFLPRSIFAIEGEKASWQEKKDRKEIIKKKKGTNHVASESSHQRKRRETN